MSHIRCPLCGKNAPISTFDPSGLDMDLRVLSFRGLGRGRGFEVSEEYSVLGDEEFSPLVAERALSLCRLFLDEGVLNSDYILDKLGVKPTLLTSGEFPPLIKSRIIYVPMKSSGVESDRAREEMKEQEKELELERKIDRELLRFVVHFPYIVINEDEIPWTVTITDVDVESLPVLVALFGGLNIDTQKRLLKRLKSENPIIQTFLEIFTQRPRKTISEIMMEQDPQWILERFDLGMQLHIPKIVNADDLGAQNSSDTPFKKREKNNFRKIDGTRSKLVRYPPARATSQRRDASSTPERRRMCKVLHMSR